MQDLFQPESGIVKVRQLTGSKGISKREGAVRANSIKKHYKKIFQTVKISSLSCYLSADRIDSLLIIGGYVKQKVYFPIPFPCAQNLSILTLCAGLSSARLTRRIRPR